MKDSYTTIDEEDIERNKKKKKEGEKGKRKKMKSWRRKEWNLHHYFPLNLKALRHETQECLWSIIISLSLGFKWTPSLPNLGMRWESCGPKFTTCPSWNSFYISQFHRPINHCKIPIFINYFVLNNFNFFKLFKYLSFWH